MDNLKKLMQFVNEFCDKQQDTAGGCDTCPNTDQCNDKVWELGEKELQEAVNDRETT